MVMRDDLLNCPFCNQRTLRIMKNFATRTTTTSGRSGKKYSTNNYDTLISDKCLNCKKTDKEIKKKYRKYNYNLR